MSPYRSRSPAFWSIALALALLAFLGACSDEKSYQENNEAILNSLPRPAGTRLVEFRHTPYYEERGPLSSIPIGWTTTLTLAPPAGATPEEVIDFYLDGIEPGWEGHVEESPVIDLLTGATIGSMKTAQFRLGKASISINPANLYPNGNSTFDITADYNRYRE